MSSHEFETWVNDKKGFLRHFQKSVQENPAELEMAGNFNVKVGDREIEMTLEDTHMIMLAVIDGVTYSSTYYRNEIIKRLLEDKRLLNEDFISFCLALYDWDFASAAKLLVKSGGNRCFACNNEAQCCDFTNSIYLRLNL